MMLSEIIARCIIKNYEEEYGINTEEAMSIFLSNPEYNAVRIYCLYMGYNIIMSIVDMLNK